MKMIKVALPLVLVVLVGCGWFSALSGFAGSAASRSDAIAAAEDSFNKGLYEQAIERYKESFGSEPDQETYRSIKGAYEAYYQEEPTAKVRQKYLEDMLAAAQRYPDQAEFWERACELYIESESYSKAYDVVKKALNRGASSEYLSQMQTQLRYMTKTDYQLYTGFKTALNGRISACDGNEWVVLDDEGALLGSGYRVVGIVNDEGNVVCVNDVDARLVDKAGVPRARFDVDVSDAGCYDSESGLVPVKVGDAWRYLDVETGECIGGPYEMAGGFSNGKAAVARDGSWVVLDESLNETSETFEDIKLDLYGRCVQSGVILAKKDGVYRIYDESLNQKGDLLCDDVDVCIDGGPIAFKSGGAWGFASPEGEVVVEPRFRAAKSYANGLAAVCENGDRWGYVDERGQVVIACDFLDAFYFDKSNVSMVSKSDGTYQLLRFLFE